MSPGVASTGKKREEGGGVTLTLDSVKKIWFQLHLLRMGKEGNARYRALERDHPPRGGKGGGNSFINLTFILKRGERKMKKVLHQRDGAVGKGKGEENRRLRGREAESVDNANVAKKTPRTKKKENHGHTWTVVMKKKRGKKGPTFWT